MVFRQIFAVLAVLWVATSAVFAQESAEGGAGAPPEKIRDFLSVTGFDVAIAAIQQGAMAGPAMTGEAPDQFGREWIRLAEEVFAPETMVDDAVEMIGAVMPEALLDHGIAFYGSDLGQHIVAVENESHMQDDDMKTAEGEKLVAALLDSNSPRVDVFRAMSLAIGSVDVAIRSIVEIQVRYLMAASAAGATEMDLDEEDLRGMLMAQSDDMRRNIELHGLVVNAYAYRDLSDAQLIDYLSALQDPEMKQVYEILNAIQYEIMANRYEALAGRLVGLQPETEL